MMDVYMSTKEIQESVLARVTYETVIDGLNGYFASESRNSYITVRATFDNPDFILHEPEAWADILISWLRTKYNIFYYTGMEAKYAKTEKIQPFSERIRDEGALNSLKQLYVRVIGTEPTEPRADSRIIIAADIEAQVSIYKIQIEDLKERIAELESKFKAVCDEDDIFRARALKAEEEIKRLNAELATKWTKTSLINWLQQRARHKNVELDDSLLYSDDAWYDWTDIIDFLFDEIVKMRKEIENTAYCLETDTVHDGAELVEQTVETVCKDIMTYIRQESSRYGFELPKEIDNTPLTVESIFHDLLEALKKAKMEKEKFLIEVANRDEEIESLQKKGYDLYLEHRHYIMKGIRYEASRNGFDLPEKVDGAPLSIERAFHDLLELLKKRAAEIREVNDKLLGTEDLLHKSVDSVNAECKAVGKQMVADYEKDLLKFICKEYKNRIRLNDRFIPYDPPSVRNTITKIISDYARNRTRVDILEGRIRSIFDKHKSEFTVDDYVTNDPTIFFMLDCISAWLKSSIGDVKRYRAESCDKIEKYQLSLKDYILQGIEKRGYPCDGLQTKSIGEIVDWIIQMATCARNDLEDVKKETKNECYLYLWNALKKLNPDCDALKIDRYEYLVDRIFYELSLVNDNCKRCRRKRSIEIFDYIRRTNKAEEELKKLKNADNEINKEEDEQ